MSKQLALSLFLVTVGFNAQAQGVHATLGEDSLRFTYFTEAWGQEIGSLDIEAGILANNTNTTLLHLGGRVKHQNVSATINLSVGARSYYTSINGKTGILVALGGDLLLSPTSWSGMGIGMHYYTAPSVTAFADAEGFTEYSLSLNYQLTPQANLAFGFQLVNIDLKNELSDRDIEKGSFLSIKVEF